MTNSTATKLPTVCRTTEDYIALENAYGANNYKPLDVVLERGEGVWVWDVDGNRYLDCLAAYSAVNQGHAHPRILKAMVEQAAKLPLTSRAFRNTQLPQLARDVCELLGFARMLPMNSGAEAVESALKIARKWGYAVKGIPAGKAHMIVCDGNFHGRTISIVSFSTEELYRAAFSPFTPGFTVIPYGDAEALEAAITPETCGFLVEPIQGEAGVVIPPAGFLQKARQICDKHKVLLISDEIQTGLGRTGYLMDCMADGVHPDVAIIGKALSGGFYPVSAVLAQEGILELFTPGEHGSTFGGNPLACAVARESLKVLVEEKLVERARTQGAYLMEKLSHVKSPHIKEIRGRGLMVGVDLHPSAGGARRFCEMLQKRGILCKETHDNVIRLAPPLCIQTEELDFLVQHLAEVLA